MTDDPIDVFFIGGPLYGIVHVFIGGKVPQHCYHKTVGDNVLQCYSLVGVADKKNASRGVIYEYTKDMRDPDDEIRPETWCWFKDLAKACEQKRAPQWQAGVIRVGPIYTTPPPKYVPDPEAPRREVAVRHVTARKLTGVRPVLKAVESA